MQEVIIIQAYKDLATCLGFEVQMDLGRVTLDPELSLMSPGCPTSARPDSTGQVQCSSQTLSSLDSRLARTRTWKSAWSRECSVRKSRQGQWGPARAGMAGSGVAWASGAFIQCWFSAPRGLLCPLLSQGGLAADGSWGAHARLWEAPHTPTGERARERHGEGKRATEGYASELWP